MSIPDILTPDYFRAVYLDGVRTASGVCGLGSNASKWQLADDVILHHIMSGIAYVGRELELDLLASSKRQYVERYDQMDWHNQRWYLKSSKVRPLKRVYKLEIQRGQFSNADADGYYEMPIEWLQIASAEQGTMVVTPYTHAPAGIAHLPWGSSLDTWFRWMPLFVRVTQSSGFEFDLVGTVTVSAGSRTATVSGAGADDTQQVLKTGMRVRLGDYIGTILSMPTPTTFTLTQPVPEAYTGAAVVYDIDPMVLDAIAYHALVPVLESIATRLFGPFTGKSVSHDNMSQSRSMAVSSQSSAMYSFQLRAQERRDASLESLARVYKPFNMFSW